MNEILQQAMTHLHDPGDFIASAKILIEERFGAPGLIAVGLLIASALGLILSKAVKLIFDIVRYVAIPSVAITFIGTYFLPHSFVYILPVTVAFFSVVLMVKG